MTLPAHCHRRVHIGGAGDLLIARGMAADLAAGAALTPAGRERVNLIVTELGTNVVRHAPGGGTMLLRPTEDAPGVECICTDSGPGIEDLSSALRDGQTSAASLGFGLGAVRRLSDTFAIHSEPQIGTAVLTRVHEGEPPPPPPIHFGAVMLAMAGMQDCGDGWVVTADGLVAMIDGLGHRPEASLAARRAEQSMRNRHDDPRRAIDAMHMALRGTRGAVAMVVRLGQGSLRYTGVGNISAAVIGLDRVAQLHNSWGVVGGNAAPRGPHEVAWQPDDVLLMHSDGVSKTIALFGARHLRYVEPTLAAAVLLRDAATKLDDQTVMVVRGAG